MKYSKLTIAFEADFAASPYEISTCRIAKQRFSSGVNECIMKHENNGVESKRDYLKEATQKVSPRVANPH